MATSNEEKNEKVRVLSETVKELRERFGEGTIMKLGEVKKVDVDAIPTGSISLDIALGVGGVPKGRIIEIYGHESSGKTTLALHIVAEAQKKKGLAAFIDAEHALDPEYAKKIGVKVDDLLISQPDSGEQALQIVESLVKSGAVDVIVVDSVAALTPRAEIEGEIGDQHIGLQARLMSQALRKLTSIASKSGSTIIFINQIRTKIGVMFGNPETTPGGKALKFYSSVRIEVRR
ncbi:recombinase RecA, partial [Candidatus Azambacteria bacterium RIFCSPHIGHO2_01_46_10]